MAQIEQVVASPKTLQQPRFSYTENKKEEKSIEKLLKRSLFDTTKE